MKIVNLAEQSTNEGAMGMTEIAYLTNICRLAQNHLGNENILDIHLKIKTISSTMSALHILAFEAAEDSKYKKTFEMLQEQLKSETNDVINFVNELYNAHKKYIEEERKNQKLN